VLPVSRPANKQYLSRKRVPMSQLTCRQFDVGMRCMRQASKPCAPKARRPREPASELALSG
jgi:hypothetical protein